MTDTSEKLNQINQKTSCNPKLILIEGVFIYRRRVFISSAAFGWWNSCAKILKNVLHQAPKICNAALKQGPFSSHPSWWSVDEVLTVLPGSLLIANPLNWCSCSGGVSSASPSKFLAGPCGGLKTLYHICVPQELGGEREGEGLRSFLQNLLEVPVVFASWLNSYRASLNREVTEFNFTPVVGGLWFPKGA